MQVHWSRDCVHADEESAGGFGVYECSFGCLMDLVKVLCNLVVPMAMGSTK